MRAEFVCPACRQTVHAPPSLEGAALTCPKCQTFVACWPAPVKQPVPTARPVPVPPPSPPKSAPAATRPPPRLPPPPLCTNPAGSFVWWQGQYSGRTFPFHCPGCGTTVQLRARVTQSKRKCPGCGFAITIAAIDQQLEDMEPERRRRMMPARGCAGGILVAVGGASLVVARWLL